MASYVDPEALLIAASRAALPNDVNVQTVTDPSVPLQGRTVIITAVSGATASNAPPTLSFGAWVVQVSCLARGMTEAQALTDLTLGALVALETTTVPGAGFVSTVTIDQLPIRSTPATANTGVFAQYNFQITVRLRPDGNA